MISVISAYIKHQPTETTFLSFSPLDIISSKPRVIKKSLSYTHLYSKFFVEFLKDLSLVLYSSSYTPLLSVLLCLIHQQTTTFMLMILNFSYHSQLWIHHSP